MNTKYQGLQRARAYGMSRTFARISETVVLAQAFESLRFPLEQGESFSDLSCLTCARQPARLASSVSNLTSPCNERTWNAKGTDTIMTSSEHEAPKTCTKRSTALRSPIFPLPSSPLDQRPVHRLLGNLSEHFIWHT